MNLGVFLAIGESFSDFREKGQEQLISEYLLKNYSKNFQKVFVFSYGDEKLTLFKNVYVLPNRWKVHRYLYSLLLPFMYPRIIFSCSVLRGLQLTGGLPGAISRVFFGKKFTVNYGYNYQQFAKIEKKPFQTYLYQITEPFILKFCTAIIVTAPYLEKYLLGSLPKEKIHLIPNGVNINVFKKYQVEKKYDIIYIGRFEKQKNLENLVKATYIANNNLRLLFVGKGSQENKLRKLSKKFRVNVAFKKPVSHEKVPQMLQQARLFILPSIIEGQPKILLEAMACEMPVIASDIAAHREIITHGVNGILCDTTAKSIAETLLSTLRSKRTKKNISKNARKTVAGKFSMKALNKKEVNLLKQVSRKV